MHYHVVEFINGCLNDYDSGPIESLDDARLEVAQWVEDSRVEDDYGTVNGIPWEPTGVDRFTRGIHILKIEECHEDCEEE